MSAHQKNYEWEGKDLTNGWPKGFDISDPKQKEELLALSREVASQIKKRNQSTQK